MEDKSTPTRATIGEMIAFFVVAMFVLPDGFPRLHTARNDGLLLYLAIV